MDTPELPFPRVVCASIKFLDKRFNQEIIITGARHYDKIMRGVIKFVGREYLTEIEQGFIDQFGNFLTREEALRIATENNQIYRRCGGDNHRLYSENLY